MGSETPRSLRRAYVEWVEEQIEEFKERIPRSHLLAKIGRASCRERV